MIIELVSITAVILLYGVAKKDYKRRNNEKDHTRK